MQYRRDKFQYQLSKLALKARLERLIIRADQPSTRHLKLSKIIINGAFDARHGFTLMEVVVTLGILALFVGMLGLFPQLMTLSADSANETRSAQIAAQVIRDMVPTLDSLPPLKGTSGNEEIPEGSPLPGVPYIRIFGRNGPAGGEVQNVNLTTPSEHSSYYDQNGLPVSAYDSSALFHAEVKINPDEDRPGFCQVEVNVKLLSASASTRPYSFVTKIAFPRQEEPGA